MPPKVEAALARRLEMLTGEDAACCVVDLRADAAELGESVAFREKLTRAKALADENRLLALALIRRRGSMCGCELQAALGLTHATVSHHMATLVEAKLVVSERRGKWVHYSVAPDAIQLIP